MQYFILIVTEQLNHRRSRPHLTCGRKIDGINDRTVLHSFPSPFTLFFMNLGVRKTTLAASLVWRKELVVSESF